MQRHEGKKEQSEFGEVFMVCVTEAQAWAGGWMAGSGPGSEGGKA